MHSLKIVYFEREDPETERALRMAFPGPLENRNNVLFQTLEFFRSEYDECIIKYIAVTEKEALTPEKELSVLSFNIPYATYKE